MTSMTDRMVAVVTGAGSGIGREVALRFSSRMRIAVCDLNADSARETVTLIDERGGCASAWQVDVADHGAVKGVIAEVMDRYGRIDVLVNAAGIAHVVPFLELTEAQWDRMMDVNLKSVFNFTQAVLPAMKERRWGRIVSISSVGGLSGIAAHSHYAAAKGALHSFTKALCKEIGPWGVTINVVAPGAVDTPMLGLQDEAAMERYKVNPMGKIGTPGEIAHAVEYFASEEAGFTTGWVLSANGGMYT